MMTNRTKLHLTAIAAFALGVSAAHIDRIFHQEDPIIRGTVFGFYNFPVEDYPVCQTDMEMSEYWSDRLMYLNGIWTAGCVAETDRRRRDEADNHE